MGRPPTKTRKARNVVVLVILVGGIGGFAIWKHNSNVQQAQANAVAAFCHSVPLPALYHGTLTPQEFALGVADIPSTLTPTFATAVDGASNTLNVAIQYNDDTMSAKGITYLEEACKSAGCPLSTSWPVPQPGP
jgi:hypothetical protein